MNSTTGPQQHLLQLQDPPSRGPPPGTLLLPAHPHLLLGYPHQVPLVHPLRDGSQLAAQHHIGTLLAYQSTYVSTSASLPPKQLM